MERIPPADAEDLTTLRAVGWISGSSVVAGDLFDLLRTGPDPEGALRRVAHLGRTHPDLLGAAVEDELVGSRLVALAGGSRALMAVVEASTHPLAIFAGSEGETELNTWERLAGLAAEDLAGELDMPVVASRIASVADAAAAAVLEALEPDQPFAIVAMGKWGGCELNYASDVDLVFVHEGDDGSANALAAGVVRELGRRDPAGPGYRVDTGLRPEGASGPLSRSLGSYRSYWDRWAETWEMQALLKARVVVGDVALGKAFLESAAEFVFPERLGADAVRAIRVMKARSERLLGRAELKQGVGGLRDIEFAVQLLQLVHGRADTDLRTQNTLQALQRLATGGYVDGAEAERMAESYRWLRNVEHRLQLVDLRQTHSVPEGAVELERLARAMGFRDRGERSAHEQFADELSSFRAEVRSIHERLFYRPILDALADSAAASLSLDAARDRLAAFGFLDSAGTRSAVTDLTAGLSRRSTLMQHMLPLLMEWLSRSPDPDLGLSQLRRLVTSSGDADPLVTIIRDDPVAAERLCLLLGSSRFVGRLLDRLPPLVPRLGDDQALASWPGPAELRDEAVRRVALADDPAAAVQRFHAEHLLEVAVADLAELIDVVEVGHRLADLADATVAAALGAGGTDDARGVAVVAMGKWGGRELNYSSDLDALFVADGDATVETAVRAAERVVALLGGPATRFPALSVDLDLRPEGRKGALARSLRAYETYWDQWAGTWEVQSLLRARPAVGDIGLGARFLAAAQQRLAEPRPGVDREVAAMKARIERERIPVGEDPRFHLKLGRGSLSDVEWTVQLLQWRHFDPPGEPSTLDGLEALAATGRLASPDKSDLDRAYRFCAEVRNRLFLIGGVVRDSLPTDPEEAARLGRSLGYTAAPRASLREDYRRVTRRARRVVERLFYGVTEGE